MATTLTEPVVSSLEKAGRATARIQGTIASPYAELRDALAKAKTWCEMLVLPTHNQRCEAASTAAGTHLTVLVGGESAGARPFLLRMALSSPVATGASAESTLSADAGPFGTTGYEISLALVNEGGLARATLSLSFSMGFGTRLALNSYLVMSGGKVGFSRVDAPGGRSELVGGARGMVERAAMRHWLALEAWIAASHLPASQRADARARAWIAAAGRYPLQLREPPASAYLDAKRVRPEAPGG